MLDATQVAAEKAVLQEQIEQIYVCDRGIRLAPDKFLHRTWNMLGMLVGLNKQNPLIQDAIKNYPDLTRRAFFIITALFGAYSLPPTELDLLREFVHMLDDDLDEKELRVWAYAKNKNHGFFPGLFGVMEQIRRVYDDTERFRPDMLPSRPYQAYAIFVLNNPEKISEEISLEELFNILVGHDSQFNEIVTLAGGRSPKK